MLVRHSPGSTQSSSRFTPSFLPLPFCPLSPSTLDHLSLFADLSSVVFVELTVAMIGMDMPYSLRESVSVSCETNFSSSRMIG